ncbi:hypothetical protein [uncultured Dokdonia sp.]|uniref:hypothetical protein n=1 Tax=uncultured Dokdonia sp. TaxID=575653 RepID=UPI002604F3AF|nr:hypothetical protein [uncultured Dokdonia sp.]
MKKFIFKLLLFILPVILFPVLIASIDALVFKKNNSQSDVKILIIGDSHTETGINDGLNPKIKNISQSGETYFFTYYKLKKILSNEDLSKVVLSLSPHNLSFFQDEKTYALNNSDRYKNLYPRYFFSLEPQGVQKLNENSQENIYSVLNLILKTNIKTLIKGRNAYIGNYKESQKSNLDTLLINEKIKTHFYNSKNELYDESQVQIEYLKKIHDLCIEKGIGLYIINLPVHNLYKSQIPTNATSNFEKVILELKNKGVSILEYSQIELPDNYFGDGDHINSFGANQITQKLIKDLKL